MTQDLVQLGRERLADCDVATLTLNRPERHNALVPALLHELLQHLETLHRTPPEVLLLQAAGRSFSTGGDVSGFYQTPRAQRHSYSQAVVGALHQAILQLLGLPCPTVVLVHGTVTGGSLGLVLACDIAIGTPQASFTPWYTRVGFSPDGGWTTLLSERLGRSRALEIQLRNRKVDAASALQLGLLHELVDSASLASAAHACLADLAQALPGSVRHTLAQLRPDLQTVAAGLAREQQHFLEQIVTDEADAGMQTFLGLAPARSRPLA